MDGGAAHRIDITEFFSSIPNMGFQFWAIWAALGSKGNFFNDATLKTGINVRVGLFIFENV